MSLCKTSDESWQQQQQRLFELQISSVNYLNNIHIHIHLLKEILTPKKHKQSNQNVCWEIRKS